MPDHELEPLSFSEAVAVDNYRAAMTGALTAADSLADKLVVTTVSVATAYGAVIALVAPKDSQTPWQAAVPFAPLAIAIGVALYAQSIGIPIDPNDKLEVVRKRIERTITSKRAWGRGALGALVLGLLVAGGVVYEYYGPSAKETKAPAQVTLYLTPIGSKAIGLACGRGGANSLKGLVNVTDLSAEWVPIRVTRAACPSGAGLVNVPRRGIAATKG